MLMCNEDKTNFEKYKHKPKHLEFGLARSSRAFFKARPTESGFKIMEVVMGNSSSKSQAAEYVIQVDRMVLCTH